MFWTRFFSLCETHSTKPLNVVKTLGVSSGSITNWENGVVPNGETLIKIANYFNVSVDYLLGLENDTSYLFGRTDAMTDFNTKDIASRIKQLCKGKKIPVKSVLEKCSLNRNFIYDLENKGTVPSAETIKKIADYFSITTDYLLGRTDDINQKPGQSNIKFDDFSYAMYNESRDLSEDDKQRLLTFARMLRETIEKDEHLNDKKQ